MGLRTWIHKKTGIKLKKFEEQTPSEAEAKPDSVHAGTMIKHHKEQAKFAEVTNIESHIKPTGCIKISVSDQFIRGCSKNCVSRGYMAIKPWSRPSK